MKTIYKRLGIGFSAIAACTSLALAAQASTTINNYYIGSYFGSGAHLQCFSPQEGFNDCNLRDNYAYVISAYQTCGSNCGTVNIYGITVPVFERWELIVP
ncbi:hypothetical protein [Sorangium cellulosum]|uniref:hypothetical protein n=1 Tax=Sorangium cellulosum TaxID=56 RepID=UPI000AFCD4E5|nr:hypothetical protein [Sorangium cellulosum]